MEQVMIRALIQATFETIYITLIVSVFVLILGIIIGISLYATKEEKLFNNKFIYETISQLVNILRSIPFIILLIIVMPFTNLLMGVITGPNAALPALIISVSPFYGRMVESALADVNKGVIELGFSLGFNKQKIITRLILKEAKPTIVSGFISIIITIISFSAMAGVIGAGGLGSLAYTYGFQRNMPLVTLSSTVMILFLVYGVQFLGNKYVNKTDHR